MQAHSIKYDQGYELAAYINERTLLMEFSLT